MYIISKGKCSHIMYCIGTVLEITVGPWSFTDQFQRLANQNLAIFSTYFQWDSSVIA